MNRRFVLIALLGGLLGVDMTQEELRVRLSAIYKDIGEIWGDADWVKVELPAYILCLNQKELVAKVVFPVEAESA